VAEDAVVLLELGAEAARLRADDRVGPRVERFAPPEDLDPDRVLLEGVGPAGQRLLDHEGEQPAEAVRL
jgi:hypothetical protein